LLLPCYLWIYSDAWTYLKTALDWLTGIAWLIPAPGKFNPVVWSLIVEVFFHILLPLVFLVLRSVPYRTNLWAIFLGFLIIPLGAR